ncbi:SAV_2336 N-terminal domain-related protein [Streptomyces sp. NPDC004788]
MIERLAALLRTLNESDTPPSGREVAELVWLAGALPQEETDGDPADGGQVDVHPRRVPGNPPTFDRPESALRPARPHARVFLPDAGLGSTAPSPPCTEQSEAPVERATPVRVPGPATLPRRRELARALRPLKRRAPSPVRTELDEDATASRIADHRHWLPVLVPAADRWLDVNLVFDAYDTGAVFWEPLARELRAFLDRLGAFRSVRLHHLLPRPDGTAGLGRLLRPPASAVDPTGRTLTLVLTDGVAPAWRTATLLGPLRDWSASGPTAILQTLPERVWDQTALPPRPGRFRTTESGAPNPRMEFKGYGIDTRPTGAVVPVPVLGVTPEWLAPWARAIARPDAFDGAAVLLPAAGPLPTEAEPAHERRAGFEEFQARAHPDVFRLAAYLAAAPLNLAVMRTVQSALLPHSPPSDLAEIVYSGLLHRVGPDRPTGGPLDRAYDFVPGVRERLLATLRRDEADDVLTAVSAYVDDHAPALGARFTAAIADPDGPLTLPVGARHWAEVHTLVRRRQGRGPVTATAPVRAGRRLLVTSGRAPWAREGFRMIQQAFGAFGYQHVPVDEPGPADSVVVYHADNDDVDDLEANLEALLLRDPHHVLMLVEAPSPWPIGELPLQRYLDMAGPVTNVWAVTTPADTFPRADPLFARAVVRALDALEAGPGRRYVDIDSFVGRLRDACEHLDPPLLVTVGRNAGLAATPPFFPNPFYAPRLAEGAHPITNAPALAAVSSWLHQRRPGVCFVVGSPGSGKTTVLESLLTLTGPDRPDRDVLPASPLPPTDLRYLTLDQADGPYLAHETVIVVDDAEDPGLLRSLASRYQVMVVAAIDRTAHIDPFGDDPVARVDLDSPDYRLPMDIYSRCLAAGIETEPDVAEEIGAALAAHSGHSHAMARLLAQRIRARHVSLVPGSAAPTWSDLTWALDSFVRRFGDGDAGKALRMLRALAYAEGEGVPGPVWQVMTTCLMREDCTARDIAWLHERMDGFLTVTATPDGLAYRLPHPSFAAALREDVLSEREVQRALFRALRDLAPPGRDGEGRDWEAAPWYVVAHAVTHAAQGGMLAELLADADFLVAADVPALAQALRVAGTASAVARAYLSVAGHLERTTGDGRRDLLALAVLRHGDRGLALALARGRGWRPLWALAETGVTAVDSGSSPDGRRVVLGDREGACEVRDATTGTVVGRIAGVGPVRWVTCAVARGKQFAAVGWESGEVSALRLRDGELRGTRFESPPWRLVAGTDAGGSPHLVVAGEGEPLLLWDLFLGQTRHGHPFLPGARPVALACTRVGGRVHTVTAAGSHLEVVPLEGEGVIRELPHFTDVLDVACTTDGVAVAGTEHGIHVWLVDRVEQAGRLGPPLPVPHVAVESVDGRNVVVGARTDGLLQVWGHTPYDAPPLTLRLPGPAEALTLVDRILTVVVGGDVYALELPYVRELPA